MLSYIVICTVALLASMLTFFSGFGLGTLLLPAFALFVPVEVAVASTAIVHFLNGLFKLHLVGRHADRRVLWRFGVPAMIASFIGALVLVKISTITPMWHYQAFDSTHFVSPIKFIIGVLLLVFAAFEIVPRLKHLAFDAKWLPLGGILSGFFGGLSGMQGALRSAFLARSGLSKEAFIGTGVVIACLIDVSRLSIYGTQLRKNFAQLDLPLIAAAVCAAFLGAWLGQRGLKKVTMRSIQSVVAVCIALFAMGLIAGWI